VAVGGSFPPSWRVGCVGPFPCLSVSEGGVSCTVVLGSFVGCLAGARGRLSAGPRRVCRRSGLTKSCGSLPAVAAGVLVSEAPIQAFVGANGSGKTYGGVHQLVVPAWKRGKVVCSNLRLYPERGGYSPDLFVPLTSWVQLVELRDCVLFLDEISSVLPSRQASTVPPDLMRRIGQLRKNNVVLCWTAPAWARCDVALREVTQVVTLCRSRVSDGFRRQPGTYSLPTRPRGRALLDDRSRRVRTEAGWAPKCWFTWSEYDARELDEFTYSTAARARPKRVRHHWRPKHESDQLYQSTEDVGLLDHLLVSGVCLGCGGRRTQPACSCDDGGPVAVVGRRGSGPVVSRAERKERALR
jgi:hypothetical protein